MPKSETDEYIDELAESWQQTYKKSLTTLVILRSLKTKPMWSKQLAEEIEKLTNKSIVLDEKSLHRALRRLVDLDLIDYLDQRGNRTGANRKVFNLTDMGKLYLKQISGLYINL